MVSLHVKGTLHDIEVVQDMIFVLNHEFGVKVFPILLWFEEK